MNPRGKRQSELRNKFKLEPPIQAMRLMMIVGSVAVSDFVLNVGGSGARCPGETGCKAIKDLPSQSLGWGCFGFAFMF